MEVVAGKCLICDECNYVLSGTDKKVYLDLLQRFNIVDGQYSTRFSKLFNSNDLCVICAYGLKSCAANLETIKKKAKTKKRTLSDKSCSLCFDADNVFLCITILKDEILTYLDAIKADIDVAIKRICINCFHCVTVHNNLSKRVRTLMTLKNITDSETDSRISKKKSGLGKNKLDNKRKREIRATTRTRGFPESPTSDSEIEDPVFKRRRLSKQTKIISKKNKKNVDDLDNMLQHLETVDAVIKTTNIDLNFKASADERMMFDISYVRCDAIEDKQKASNIDTSTASIEISDDDVTETRTSGRVAKRPNYALILKPRKNSALKCGTCGEHFSTAYRLKSHSKARHESSEMNGNAPVRQTRSKAARKEMYYDTDSEAERSKSEHSINESEESPKVAQSSRSQKKVKMSGNKIHKKEQNSNKLVNTKADSPKNSRSLKRKIGNKGSEDEIEKDDSKSEHESELDSDIIQKKGSSEKVAHNSINSSDEKNSEDSEIEDDNTKKSEESNKDDVTNISESENENTSEHIETDDADNTVKPKEKSRPSKQKDKSNVKKISSDEKSDHSEIEDDDDTDKSKSKVHLQKEKRSSNESQNKSDDDNVELSKRSKKYLESEENNSVNKTNKGKVSDINSKTRSPKGKRNNIKDKEACDNASESEHENNLTKNKSSPKIKKTRKNETSEEEHLEKEKSKLPEGENNNENVDETEESEKSEKEIDDEDHKSTDDNPIESSETPANSSKEKITLSKEQDTDESEKDIEATDKESDNDDAVQNSEEQTDITIAEKSKESPKNIDSDAEEIADNDIISINEESNDTNDKENEIDEQTLTKEDEDNDRLVVNEENSLPDNGTITINEDAASDTTEILTEDFSLSQKISNEETNPAGSNEIEVEDDNSESETLKLSSASINDTENEKTEKADKSTGKNNPSDFNYVEKLLENLGAMANGNKRTFKIQLSSAKDSS